MHACSVLMLMVHFWMHASLILNLTDLFSTFDIMNICSGSEISVRTGAKDHSENITVGGGFSFFIGKIWLAPSED